MLIDFGAVKTFSTARGCDVTRRGRLACEMTGPGGTTAMCTSADAEGKTWDVLEVFRACHRARAEAEGRRRPGAVEPPAELDIEWHGLREDVIAAAMAADGIWPYRSGRRSNALDALLAAEARGGFIPTADSNPKVKMAARAVIDAGLADHIVGPRGGLYVAIRWTPAARRAVVLAPGDEDAIAAAMAAGK